MRVPRSIWGAIGPALLLLGSCSTEDPSSEAEVRPPLDPGAITPAQGTVKRLTQAQYRAVITDLFSEEISLPALEPDTSVAGFIAVGAAQASLSPWGVEQYEAAAFSVAQQALADPATRDQVVGCTPKGTDDEGCARTFLSDLASRAFRRAVKAEELDPIVSVATDAAATLGDFYAGLEFGIATVLQSPSFLYRPDLGESDPERPEDLRYSGYEMASRLSFLFWNMAPDETLLARAEDQSLLTDEGIQQAVERLLSSPLAKQGIRNFFSERFELYELDRLTKDPTVFTHYNPELGASAKEETLRGLEYLIFDLDGDYRDFFTTQTTFVDRRLAALYGIPAPQREGFGMQKLGAEGGRRGFLGQASFLALRSHAVSTSATLRGKFVKEILLCRSVPPPPVNANTAIPEVSESARTLRERLTIHMQNPACSSCHLEMDTIGLGFEQFDGVARWREKDNGAPINPSGNIDDIAFSDAWSMAEIIHDHPDLGPCFVKSLYEYATAHEITEGESKQIEDLSQRFAASGFRVKSLLMDIALSPGFRRVTEATQ